MAYELAEQMDWRWPDWIIYPTGGGTGMVGMWKAFDEIERIGWVAARRRPRMVSVQAEGCAPIVRAFEQGAEKAPAVGRRRDARRRPARAARDRRLPDPARRARKRRHARSPCPIGRWSTACSRSASTPASAPRPRAAPRSSRFSASSPTASIKPHESVVLFNTGGALKLPRRPEASVAQKAHQTHADPPDPLDRPGPPAHLTYLPYLPYPPHATLITAEVLGIAHTSSGGMHMTLV